MPDPTGVPSLAEFVESVDSVARGEFASSPMSKVANDAASNRMKERTLGLYQDVGAVNSFVDETGAIYDCIPIEQQPATRISGGRWWLYYNGTQGANAIGN